MKRSHLHGSGRGSRKNPLVLVFHTASRAYWNDIAQGIVAFAKTADWNLQVVEGEPDARASFGELVRFWRPDGCIFEDSIARYARSDILELEDFEDAVKAARAVAKPGDVVVLSPACAAFDQFKNFMELGKVFKKLVQTF